MFRDENTSAKVNAVRWLFEEMRDRKSWMNKASDPVLELLSEEFALNARSIWYTLQYRAPDEDAAPGRSTVYRALENLEEHGFVRPLEHNNSYYVITERGEAYLQGDRIEDLDESE